MGCRLIDLFRAGLFGGERHGFGLKLHREREKIGNDGIIGIDDRAGQPAALFRLLAEVVCSLGVFHTGLPQRQTASLDGRFPTREAIPADLDQGFAGWQKCSPQIGRMP